MTSVNRGDSSFGMGAAMPMCAGDDYAKRADARDNLGLRCCSP